MRATRILIDGYNLLFQTQLVGRDRSPGWVERARGRLISFLGEQIDAALLSKVTIVFDRSKGKKCFDFVSQEGIEILFANDYDEADDLLEELIGKHPQPKQLTVVSSDHRVQRRAKARKSKVFDSDAYLRELDKKQPQRHAQASELEQKEPDLSQEQIQFWLDEFLDD